MLPSRRLKIVAVLFATACLTVVLIKGLTTHQISPWGSSHRAFRTRQHSFINQYSQTYSPSLEANQTVSIPAARRIQLGLQLENIYDLDLRNRSFKAEGWYWLRYTTNVRTLLEKHKIGPSQIIRLANAVDSDSLNLGYSITTVLSEQENYSRLHFSGRFYIPDMEMYGFPFYRLYLPIVMESSSLGINCSPENKQDCIRLIFSNTNEARILGRYIDINGFITKGVFVSESTRRSPTDFGWKNWPSFSEIKATVEYVTDPSDSFWQHIFPVIVLIGIAILSPTLQGSMGDLRIAIPPTVLLTLIFLQQSYQGELPALAYSTYLDWLYSFSFVIAFALF